MPLGSLLPDHAETTPSAVIASDSNEVQIQADQSNNNPPLKDQPEHWWIVFGVFAILFISVGRMMAIGVFFHPLQQAFHLDRGTLSLAPSIAWSMSLLLAPFAGELSTRFGIRMVAICGGALLALGLVVTAVAQSTWMLFLGLAVLSGLGESGVRTPVVAHVGLWFDKYMSLALGLSMAGSGVGTLAIGVPAQLWISAWGWRWATIILAASTLVIVCSAALLLRPYPHHHAQSAVDPAMNQSQKPCGRLFDFVLFRDWRFVVMLGVTAFASFGYNVPFVHVVNSGRDLGMTPTHAALLLTYLGVFNVIGRAFYGHVADSLVGKRVGLLLALGIMVASVSLWGFVTSANELIAFCCVYGLAVGGFVGLLPPVFVDIFGRQHLAARLGTLYASSAGGTLLGPFVAGTLWDHTHSFVEAGVFAGGVMFLGCVCIVVLLGCPSKCAERARTRGSSDLKQPLVNASQ